MRAMMDFRLVAIRVKGFLSNGAMAANATLRLPGAAALISPIHKRAEGRAPMWGSEFTSKNAALKGWSAKLLLG